MGLLSLSTGFWCFDDDCKRDVLNEHRHMLVIVDALCDKETCIELVDAGTFILYGEEQALLLSPKNVVLRLTMFVYNAICSWRDTYE